MGTESLKKKKNVIEWYVAQSPVKKSPLDL